MKRFITLTAVLFLAATVYAGDVRGIGIVELNSLIQDKRVTLLDANGTESWQKRHIPGAIDFETSKDKLSDLLPANKDALIVAYCGSPKCMAYKAAVAAAQKLGYTNVKHLPAGIKGWVRAGEPTDSGK